MSRRCGVALVLALALTAVLPARADEVADFYKGKRVTLLVSYGPGGGYDVYARVLARHIGRHIPGNPNIVVQNMPGAGSLRGANYLYNVAPKDGTMFGTFARNMAMLGLLKSGQNVQFDPRKFTWLGSSSSLANDAYVLILRRDAKVKSIEDARRPGGPPVILGSTAEGTSSDAMGVLLREWLGFNLKVIAGYTDSGVLFLAIERGEVDGRTVGLSSVRANKADWLKPNGFGRVMVVAKNATDRNLIEILEMPYALSRPYAAPPDVPPERARALQQAFIATHKDPAYLADAEKVGIEVSPIDGEAIRKLIDQIGRTPADQLKRIENLITAGG
jgi:tripartite-type tricarboxylate transporter receptor subunit TctC